MSEKEIWAAIEEIRKELDTWIRHRDGTPRRRGKEIIINAQIDFCGEEAAYVWLIKPNSKLGGLEPLTVAMQSVDGLRQANALLREKRYRRHGQTPDQELDMLLERLEEEKR